MNSPFNRSKKKRTILWIATGLGFTLMTVFTIVFANFKPYLDTALSKVGKSTSSEVTSAGKELANEIEGEGAVLVKNDNILPLEKTTKKVNVFGWNSTHWIKSGSGSGQVNSIKVDFVQALKDYGISVNENLLNCYNKFRSEDRAYSSNGALNSTSEEFSRLYEPSISDTSIFSASTLKEAKDYSDVAIVTFGRITGESNDCPKSQHKQTKAGNGSSYDSTDDTRTYLDISTEEEELLKYVAKNYDKTIVIINSTNTMNLGFMDEIEGLDACLVVGATGTYAAEVIPQILYGDINPSGRLTDTYAYDFKSNPNYAHSGEEGEGQYLNAESMYPYSNTNPNIGNKGGQIFGRVSYLDYCESIYVGYRWYETAYAEKLVHSVNGTTYDYSTEEGYNNVVQYPFGYGLSYTTFEWNVKSVSPKKKVLEQDSEITVDVEVKNTGKVAGKDVVELYYTPEYKSGGIEKAYVNLADFAKTDLLEPGESQTLSLTLKAEDMASYDYSGKVIKGGSGYVLERGKYQIKLMKNAHELGPVTSGDAMTEYSVNSNIRYETDSVTGVEVSNKFTGKTAYDGVSIDGSNTNANITYLSRSDFSSTFPYEKAANREVHNKIKKLNTYSRSKASQWADDEEPEVTLDADNGLKVISGGKLTELGEKLGKDYNAEEWDALLDQLTEKELKSVTLHGTYKTGAMKSIGIPQTAVVDGTSQFGSWGVNLGDTTTGFPMPTVLAQTFNKSLANAFGKAIGSEASQSGFDGWYGPGMNIHRSAFGGRNYEYYSEDPYVSGVMCGETVSGAKSKGVYCFIKHICLYTQDSYRDSLYAWLTEQSLREIYLKGFKIAIQKYNVTGLMSSYGRIGATWEGGSSALLDGVIRQEMGFKGAIITDYSDDHTVMNADTLIRNGGDIWMDGYLSNGKYKYETSSNSMLKAMKNACKNVAYMYLNSKTGDDVVIKGETFEWWTTLLIVVDTLVYSWVLYYASTEVISLVLKKKNKQNTNEGENV